MTEKREPMINKVVLPQMDDELKRWQAKWQQISWHYGMLAEIIGLEAAIDQMYADHGIDRKTGDRIDIGGGA